MNLLVFLICKDVDCTSKLDSKSAVMQAVKDAIAAVKSGPVEGSVFYHTATLDSNIAKSAGIKIAPAVLIVDADTDRVLDKVLGDPINAASVRKKIVDLVTKGVEPGSGNNGDGIIPGGTPGGDLLGLGLFNLGFNIPSWIWLALAGVAVYKASTSKSQVAVMGFGAAGVVAGLNYLNKAKVSAIGNLPPMQSTNFDIDATGDVVTGDVIRFSEAVFGGSHRSPKYLGDRTISARVVKDSYGADKQQHTFSLVILASEGVQGDKYPPGSKTTRKGRNVYRNTVMRQQWADESLRSIAADEKHDRGGKARAQRDQRRSFY